MVGDLDRVHHQHPRERRHRHLRRDVVVEEVRQQPRALPRTRSRSIVPLPNGMFFAPPYERTNAGTTWIPRANRLTAWSYPPVRTKRSSARLAPPPTRERGDGRLRLHPADQEPGRLGARPPLGSHRWSLGIRGGVQRDGHACP